MSLSYISYRVVVLRSRAGRGLMELEVVSEKPKAQQG